MAHLTATPWHGMTLPIWFRLLSENRFSIAPSRLPLAAAITFETTFNTVARLVSETIYRRRAAATQLQHAPLFVIGHWRTGTTLLHELIVLDDQFNFATTYQCTSPHHFVLTEKVLPRLFSWTLPKQRVMDQMSLAYDSPQEDEFALCNLGAVSPYKFLAFPDRPRDVVDELTLRNLPERQQRRWNSALMWFLKRLTMRDPRRLVMKSPTHTCRVAILQQLFPEAQFVHIVRDPYKIIPSTIHTWQKISEAIGLRFADLALVQEVILDSFVHLYDGFVEQVSALGTSQFHELRYEDLIARPVEAIGGIYEQLQLGQFTHAEAVRGYFEDRSDYRPNQHSVDSSLATKIEEHCGDYMDRYGYSRRQD